jgi:GNAT superfamily N-acetyltransferase
MPCPLSLADRARLAAHFARLEPEGRNRRFFAGVSDAGVRQYAATMRPQAVRVMMDRGQVVGVAEVHPDGEHSGEVALSLEKQWRGRGLGQVLMDAICEDARILGMEEVRLIMSTHNPQIVSLSRRFGAQMVRDRDVLVGSVAL